MQSIEKHSGRKLSLRQLKDMPERERVVMIASLWAERSFERTRREDVGYNSDEKADRWHSRGEASSCADFASFGC